MPNSKVSVMDIIGTKSDKFCFNSLVNDAINCKGCAGLFGFAPIIDLFHHLFYLYFNTIEGFQYIGHDL